MHPPTDGTAMRYPVSIKGVILIDDRVALLRNGREERELPGGKLAPGEQPEACCKREIAEELALDVRVGPIVDSWVYSIAPTVDVLIVSYGCFAESESAIRLSDEHSEHGLFTSDELAELDLPDGCRRTIQSWLARRSTAPLGDVAR